MKKENEKIDDDMEKSFNVVKLTFFQKKQEKEGEMLWLFLHTSFNFGYVLLDIFLEMLWT